MNIKLIFTVFSVALLMGITSCNRTSGSMKNSILHDLKHFNNKNVSIRIEGGSNIRGRITSIGKGGVFFKQLRLETENGNYIEWDKTGDCWISYQEIERVSELP